MSCLFKIIIFLLSFLLIINNIEARVKEIKLSQPILTEGKNLRQNLQERYSNRSFNTKKTLTFEQLSTILWATYGRKVKGIDAITHASYVVPSAGAIYALEIFVVVGKDKVNGIKEGVYYYEKELHTLKIISDLDKREALSLACLNQRFIQDAPTSIIIAAQFDYMAKRYGNRAERYVIMESGHAAQNLYLIVNDLGLTTVEVGAFIDKEVSKVLNIPYPVLLVMPVGYKK